jgi:polysaccharide pyruvyl transferase WcaK-like protein
VKRAVRGVWQRVRMLRLLPQLERVQAISVGGGALLSDDNLHFPQSLVELGRYARAFDKPLLCLGCSAEGAWSPRGWRMIREFLEACSVLAVRDGETAGRLGAALGSAPPVFGDFCLSAASMVRGYPAGRHQLAINVSQLAGPWAAEQERFEDALVAAAKSAGTRMARRGVGLCIFTTGLAEDARVAQRVHARLEAGGGRLCLPASLDQLSALLNTACVVVATRLHGAILPLAGGVPVVGLGVSPKLRNFFSTMNIGRYCYEAGSSAQLADWLALVDLGVVAQDQKRELSHSAVWKVRADMQARIASFAAARGTR